MRVDGEISIASRASQTGVPSSGWWIVVGVILVVLWWVRRWPLANVLDTSYRRELATAAIVALFSYPN